MKAEKPETKTCRHCRTEIPYEAKVCPQCRRKQCSGILKWIIIGVIVVCIAAAASGGDDSGRPSDSGPKKVESASISADDESGKGSDADSQTEADGEQKSDVLSYKKYKFNGGEVSMSLSKNDKDEYSFTILIESDIPWKAATAYTLYSNLSDKEEFFNPTIIMRCGNIIITSLMSIRTDADGNTTSIDGKQWIVDEISNAAFEKLYKPKDVKKLSKKLSGFIIDFIKT